MIVTSLTSDENKALEAISERYRRENADPQSAFDVGFLIGLIHRIDGTLSDLLNVHSPGLEVNPIQVGAVMTPSSPG